MSYCQYRVDTGGNKCPTVKYRVDTGDIKCPTVNTGSILETVNVVLSIQLHGGYWRLVCMHTNVDKFKRTKHCDCVVIA